MQQPPLKWRLYVAAYAAGTFPSLGDESNPSGITPSLGVSNICKLLLVLETSSPKGGGGICSAVYNGGTLSSAAVSRYKLRVYAVIQAAEHILSYFLFICGP